MLRTSFRHRLAVMPLRFAKPSPPSGWLGDFHPQAIEHARHTTRAPPVADSHEDPNIFGNPTGRLILADKDDELPAAPRGLSLRPLSKLSAAELRARAAEYRQMAATATTADVHDGLCRVADRFDARAEEIATEA